MKFTKNNNPNKKRRKKKNPETAWAGAGSREQFIRSMNYLNQQKKENQQ